MRTCTSSPTWRRPRNALKETKHFTFFTTGHSDRVHYRWLVKKQTYSIFKCQLRIYCHVFYKGGILGMCRLVLWIDIDVKDGTKCLKQREDSASVLVPTWWTTKKTHGTCTGYVTKQCLPNTSKNVSRLLHSWKNLRCKFRLNKVCFLPINFVYFDSTQIKSFVQIFKFI